MSEKFRFDEDKILGEALTYLESTYAGHYVGELAGREQNNIQTIDVWPVSYTHLTLPTTPYV